MNERPSDEQPLPGSEEERRRAAEWERYEQSSREWEERQAGVAQSGPGPEGTAGFVAPPSFPHAEPTPYHLILRTWTYHWLRPLVGIVLLAVGMTLVLPVLALPVLLVGVAFEASGSGYLDAMTRALDLTRLSPAGLLWLNISLGSLILWTWLLNRWLHNLRPGWLTSVMPKMRWRFFWACTGLSVVALAAQLGVSMLIPSSGDPSLGSGPNPVTGTTVALLVIVLLTTPFQSAGEEYAFRGYLLQAVGALSKRAWLGLAITSLLFASAHGMQNVPLFFDRFMFGFIAGWLVMRTGGLEAGIALHILNNLLAFGMGIFFGDVGEMLNVSEISWWNIPVTLTQSLVYVVLVLLVARRMNVQRLSRPPAQEPEQTSVARGAAPVG